MSGASYMTYGRVTGPDPASYNGSDPSETPGITYSRIARNLMVRRAWLSYRPSNNFISSSAGTIASLIKNHSAAMVYLGRGASVTLDLSSLNALGSVRVQRFNPTDGAVTHLGTFPASGTRTFDGGGLNNAVILLDAVP